MWDYTLYDFKCPYCGHEYARTSGRGHNYEYKGEIYSSALYCPKCGKGKFVPLEIWKDKKMRR